MRVLPAGFQRSSILARILLSLFLAGAALGLFLLNRRAPQVPPPSSALEVQAQMERERSVSAKLEAVDHDVDSILVRFGIEKEWIRKRQVPLEHISLIRTERRIAVPDRFLPLAMNVAFNAMARRYDGRAVASENLKENTVTIHIEVGGYVIQTIIVKPTANLKRGERVQKPWRV